MNSATDARPLQPLAESQPPAVSERPPLSLTAVLAISLAATLLLFGYEFVRNVSTSLYIGAYGRDRLPIAMALAPVATVLLIYGYGLVLSWLGARRALFVSSVASAGAIGLCYTGLRLEVPLVPGLLYVLREAYIVVLIEQYWSFINSTLAPAQARRLNGPITGFGSVGAIVGARYVGQTAQNFGSENLLLFAVGSLVAAALLSDLAYRIGGEPQPTPPEAKGRQGHLALRRFGRHPYLLLLAGLVATTQVVSTVLDLAFCGSVESAFPGNATAQKDARTAYLGKFWANVNGYAFVLQFVVTPILLWRLPLALVHVALPALHVLAAMALLLRPSLTTGATAFLLFKGCDYSLFRAAKEILYLPLSYDERFRAKSVIDAFAYRCAKGVCSGLIGLAGLLAGPLPASLYPQLAMLAEGLWLVLVRGLTRQRRQT